MSGHVHCYARYPESMDLCLPEGLVLQPGDSVNVEGTVYEAMVIVRRSKLAVEKDRAGAQVAVRPIYEPSGDALVQNRDRELETVNGMGTTGTVK